MFSDSILYIKMNICCHLNQSWFIWFLPIYYFQFCVNLLEVWNVLCWSMARCMCVKLFCHHQTKKVKNPMWECKVPAIWFQMNLKSKIVAIRSHQTNTRRSIKFVIQTSKHKIHMWSYIKQITISNYAIIRAERGQQIIWTLTKNSKNWKFKIGQIQNIQNSKLEKAFWISVHVRN